MAQSNSQYGSGYAITGGTTTVSGIRLRGGRYRITVAGTGFGTATLQMLAPDGSTYVTVGSSTTFSANGSAVIDFPPGVFQVAIASATVNVSIALIPGTLL